MTENLFPRISIITPSLDQGRYVEKTIQSVFEQAYPNLEYMIVDGGSTDGSIEIIRRYDDRLTWWVSEKDRGQSHAINKGLRRCTGEIIGWLNSDDYLAPGALSDVAAMLDASTGNQVVFGHCMRLDANGKPDQLLRGAFRGRSRMLLPDGGYALHQPSIFWRREVMQAIGALDESLHLIMDFDYWFRMAGRFRFVQLNRILSYSHHHPEAKTGDSYVRYHESRKAYARAAVGRLRRLEKLEYWLIRLKRRLVGIRGGAEA